MILARDAFRELNGPQAAVWCTGLFCATIVICFFLWRWNR